MSIDGNVALWQENAGNVYNAREYRRWLERSLGFDVATSPGTGAGGIYRTADYAVSQRGAGANMSVDVAAGGAYVDGSSSATQGGYYVHNDAVVNVAIDAAHPTNARYDLVGIRVRDTEYVPGSNDAAIVVLKGIEDGSLTEPTPPANFVTLARITVGAGVASILNANLLDRRRRVTALGGIIVATTSADFPATGLWHGQVAVDLTARIAYIYDGSAWTPLGQYVRAVSFVQEILLGGDGSLDLTSIPATFGHLEVVGNVRSAIASVLDSTRFRLNGDAGANYDYNYVQVSNSVLSGVSAVAQTSVLTGGIGNSAAANVFGTFYLLIPASANASQHRAGQVNGSGIDVAAANSLMRNGNWKWRSTATVARVQLFDSALGATFKTGSHLIVKGIR